MTNLSSNAGIHDRSPDKIAGSAATPVLPVYVIHARKLTERVSHMRQQLERVGVTCEWVTDHDIEDFTPETDRRYFVENADLTPGQKSCALKHVAAMERIATSGVDRALILEDDVFLCDNFKERLVAVIAEADKDWPRPHVLHLGAATNYYTPASKLRPGKSIYLGDKVRFAEAYVLGAREATLRLAWIAAHRISLPIDGQYNVCDVQLGIPFLWAEPPFAEQGSLKGAFRSSLDVKERPRWQLRLQFPIQKFKRKYLYRWLGYR